MKGKRIKAIYGDALIVFRIDDKLPPMENDCDVRTKILRREARKQQDEGVILSEHHSAEEYWVEQVHPERFYNEVWHLGS